MSDAREKPEPMALGMLGLLGGLGLLAYGVIGSMMGLGSEPSAPAGAGAPAAPAPPNYRYEALDFTQFAIRKQLKAPSTAKFASINDEGTIIHDWGGNKFTVTSWVDSQNSFGAMIRTKYQMTVTRKDDGDWSVEDVITTP